VRIGVVQERALRRKSECDREAAAERFDQASASVCLPDSEEIRNLPTLAAGPFERGVNVSWRSATVERRSPRVTRSGPPPRVYQYSARRFSLLRGGRLQADVGEVRLKPDATGWL
jgi:hypothetical protein